MTTVLVIGGAGYIGSHTCKALAAEGMNPVAFDSLSHGHADFVRWGPLVVGDILSPAALDEVFKQYSPEAVIHFAALAYVGESFDRPIDYYQVNVGGFINVLQAMARNGVTKVVLSSSCATFGIPESLPICEDMPQRPISPYGHSKLMCEQVLKDAASSASHDIKYAILRYFNAAGADASGELPERHHPETHLIPLVIDAATGRGPPLRIFGADYPTKDGTCERDYIHVSDLADAHVAALRYLATTGTSIQINLGSGQAYSVREIISAVERIVGKPVPLIWEARRPGDPPRLLADLREARSTLEFSPRYSDLSHIVETAWRSRQ